MTRYRSLRSLLALTAFWSTVCLVTPSASAQECLLRPFGDSITAGIRADLTFAGGYRQPLVMDPPFVGRPIRMSGTHVYYSTPYLDGTLQQWNSGYPGWTLDQLWGVAPPIVPANIILVHAGTNDLLQGQFATAASDLEVLLRALIAHNPTARVLVAKIIPFAGVYESLNSQVYWYNVAVHNLVLRLKAEGWTRVDMVDMNTYFPKATGMGVDGIHPNDTGYWWMAQAWKQAITAVGCN